jgi:ABC-type transport system involved in cytochrome bd biosynthesis fused ATPase/permease subunit
MRPALYFLKAVVSFLAMIVACALIGIASLAGSWTMNLLSHAALHRGLDEMRCETRRSLKEKVAAHRAAVLAKVAAMKKEPRQWPDFSIF